MGARAARAWWRGAALVALTTMAAACGGAAGTAAGPTGSAASTSTTSSTTSSTATSTTRPASSAYPMKLTTQAGSVVIPARPTRIVSLSPTATEDLFAVGAGAQVVAVDKDSNYPPAAPRTKIDPLNPNVEAIAGYHPDLVVISGGPASLPHQLAKLHIPCLYEGAATDLGQAYQEIDSLGRVTGHAARAQQVTAGMKTKIARLVAQVHPAHPPLTYYYELSPQYYSVTSATFVGQLLAKLGLKDIADKGGVHAAGGYPQLSPETIVAARPDLIFLADTLCCGQSAKTVAARPGWSTIPAVRHGDVVPLNDDIASRWGPRVVILLTDVVHAVEKAEAAQGSSST